MRAAFASVPGPTRALWLALLLGLGIRLLILGGTAETPLQIEDERHYHQLAASMAAGRGYTSEHGLPTSMRPPLYPAFLAGVYAIGGEGSFQAVRALQIVLSLLNVLLLYRLGSLAFDRRAAALGAALFWLYPTLIGFDSFLLTEVLFTLLLTAASLGYVRLLREGSRGVALATGAAFGLAALTRSILWPFPLVLCPLAFFSLGAPSAVKWRAVTLLFLGFAVVVGPWSARNTRVHGVFTAVDTMGGLNLMMGNYEHTPVQRPWDAVSLEGEKSWAHQLRMEHPDCSTWSEGRKEKWATKRALEYMAAHPGVTLVRSVVKLCDFWGLEREIIAGFQKGLYAPPRWFAAGAAAAITVSYVAMMLLASLGFWLARPPDRRVHAYFAVLIIFIAGLHALAFGHSRYHLPLVPILILYASSAVIGRSWRDVGKRIAPTAAFLLTAGALLAIWAREVLVRDFDRIQKLLQALI
jgi:hypothetical protein